MKKYIKTLDGLAVVKENIEDDYFSVKEYVGDGTVDYLVMSEEEIDKCPEVTQKEFIDYKNSCL